MYIVEQFIITKTDLGLVVQNSKGITIVTDNDLANFLIFIDENGVKEFDIEHIKKFIDELKIKDVIEFLLDNSIIFKKIEINGILSNIGFYTNNKIAKEYILFIEDSKFIVDDINNDQTFDDYDAFVCFLSPFSILEYNRICDILSDKNIPFIMSFFYDSKFYISNLYKKEWYNPCPKCFYANLESALRAYGKINDYPSFQTIIDIIYSNNPMFEINVILKKHEYICFINEIMKFSLEKLNTSSKRIIEIDLNGNVRYDIPTHFELCDCFEK